MSAVSFDRSGIQDLIADSPTALLAPSPIPASYGYAAVVLSVCFFQSLNQLVAWIGFPKSIDRSDSGRWRNIVVSWMHAVIIGIWDITCFYRYPELLNDLVGYSNVYIYSMVAFSTGYFIHDTIDIIKRQSANMWEVLPHHFAITVMFVGNLAINRCMGYSVVALLGEINTVFLHFRKMLQMLGVGFDGPLYRANAALNLLTFAGCRFVCLVWIAHGIVVDGNRVSPLYVVAISLSMVVMCPLNAVLFWRLVSSDVIGRSGARRKIGDAAGVDNGRPSAVNGAVRQRLRGIPTSAAEDFSPISH